MKWALIDWINSARSKGKITHRKTGWVNSQGRRSDALTKVQRSGTWWAETERDVILIPSERITIRLDESSVVVVHGDSVTFRNHIPPQNAVSKIPSKPPTMPRFNFLNTKPEGGDKSH